MSGYKTYLVALAMIVYAWGGVALGKTDPAHAIDLTLEALAFAGIRNGIPPSVKK